MLSNAQDLRTKTNTIIPNVTICCMILRLCVPSNYHLFSPSNKGTPCGFSMLHWLTFCITFISASTSSKAIATSPATLRRSHSPLVLQISLIRAEYTCSSCSTLCPLVCWTIVSMSSWLYALSTISEGCVDRE